MVGRLMWLGALASGTALAESRGTKNFTLLSESISPGASLQGPPSQKSDFDVWSTVDPGSGPIANSSNVTLKPGFAGRLYEIQSASVSGSPDPVPEGATTQLTASFLLDDESLIVPDGERVNWDVDGPFTALSPTGLATTRNVFEDTTGNLSGSWYGVEGLGSLVVRNTGDDDFGAYGGDGSNDAWQVLHFGPPPNASAAPGMNPDGDPHDNRFEELSGHSPVDNEDYLVFNISDRTGSTTTLYFSKVIPGTLYRIRRSIDLGIDDPFATFAGSEFTVPAEASDHLVDDTGATSETLFYYLELESAAPAP